MKTRSTIVLTSIAISLFGMSLGAFAQSGNPLRSVIAPPNAVEPTQLPVGHPQVTPLAQAARTAMSPEAYQAAFPHRSAHTKTRPDGQAPNFQSRDDNVIVDPNVRAADFEAEANSGLKPIENLLDSLGQAPTPDLPTARKTSVTDVIERLSSLSESTASRAQDPAIMPESGEDSIETTPPPKSAKFDQKRLQSLLQQLATSTCLVMLFGVGFILVAKRWVKGSKPAKQNDELAIEIKSTLKLSPKSNLHLIQAGEQRLIVALDQNGINTVVPLNESFSNTLDSITEMAHDLESAPEPDAEEKSGVTVSFSDSLLALARKTTADNSRAVPKSTNRRVGEELDDEVRRKMETALNDQGLKDLILKQLQTQR